MNQKSVKDVHLKLLVYQLTGFAVAVIYCPLKINSMSNIQIFEHKKIRSQWNAEEEKLKVNNRANHQL